MLFCAVNTLWYLFLARIETASDQEWHKYMLFMGINTVISFGGFAATLTFAIKHYQTAISTNGGRCYFDFQDIFISIFVVICINGMISFVSGASTFALYLQLFAVNPSKYF